MTKRHWESIICPQKCGDLTAFVSISEQSQFTRPTPTPPILYIHPSIIDKLNCNYVHCVLHKLDVSIISVSSLRESIREKFTFSILLLLLKIFYGPLRIGRQYWWMHIRFGNYKTWKFNRKNNDMEIYTLIIFKYLDVLLRFDTSLSKCVDASYIFFVFWYETNINYTKRVSFFHPTRSTCFEQQKSHCLFVDL